VLIAVLLPALRKAREQANRVTCLSNQRQIYMASIQFAQDNRDILPPGTQWASPAIWINTGISWSLNNPLTSTYQGRFDWQTVFLTNYLRTPLGTGSSNKWLASANSVLFCPSGNRAGQPIATGAAGSYYDTGVTSIDYMIAGNSVVGDGHTSPTVRAGYTTFRKSKFWKQFKDSWGSVPFSFDTGTRAGLDVPHTVNGRFMGMNLIRNDGSGTWLTPEETYRYGWHPSYPTELRPMPRGFRIVMYVNEPTVLTPYPVVRIIRNTVDTYEDARPLGLVGLYVSK